jgi:hypothetical protein
MRRLTALAGAFALALVCAPAAHAAGSDSWTTATPLTYSVGDSADTTSFGTQPNEPGTTAATLGACPTFRTNTAWWSVRGHGGRMTVTTLGTDIDAVLAVYVRTPSGAPGAEAGCSDLPTRPLEVRFQAARGTTYLIQVGGKAIGSGQPGDRGDVAVTAIPERPTGDDRAAALPLATNATLDVSNRGATEEPGEVLDCGAAHYLATLWFAWTTPVPGTAVFDADASFTNVTPGNDTVLAVYRADGFPIGCNDDAAQLNGPSRMAARVTAGTYFIQVGAHGMDNAFLGQGSVRPHVGFVPKDDDGDGVTDPPDCNDNDPAIRPGARDVPDDGVDQDCDGADAVNLDRDGDGNQRPLDCDDNDPTRHRGAVDVPRNGKDEDCSGADADFPFMTATIQYATAKLGRFTLLTQLAVARPPAGASIRVTCTGPRCKGRTFTHKVKRATAKVSLVRRFRKARLSPGTVVRVRVTKADTYGKETRLTMRRGAAPTRRSRCIDPQSGKLFKC